MNQPLYIVMVGLPGSGKSFAVEAICRWIRKTCTDNRRIDLVSSDDYIDSVADARYSTYDKMFHEHIKDAIRYMNDTRNMAFSRKSHVIHDQTNLSEKKRRGIISTIPSDYYKVACLVTVNEDMRQGRLQVREFMGKTIPKEIDQSMRETMTYPTLREGFDNIVTPEFFSCE